MGLLEQIQARLDSGALRNNLGPLFYDTLGWGAGRGPRRPVSVDGQTLILTQLAELGGLPVFHAEMPAGTKLPGITYRRAVNKALTPTAQEHMLVYTTTDQRQAQFVSARRVAGGKTELRTLPYMVGAPGRTTLERLAELAFAPTELAFGDVPITQVMDRINRAFDVEAVTKAFFKEYRETFGAVEGMIRGAKGDRRLFTQRLFNRLMFIQFVAKKGWLEFDDSRDYLPALFAAAQTKGENFYQDRLYWLLFAGLGMPHITRQHEGEAKLQERRGKVPYLNGGLFELVDEDDVRGAVQIENEAIGIIMELFARHNFTIMESAPLDVMVAVDPEMLGKVFEELVTGRHETGSYYTPRPVVAFMCREALKGYLTQALTSNSTRKAGREEIERAVAAFVDDDDPGSLPHPEATLEALKRVTVCDPACGSGAYLLGMMQELLRLRSSLFAVRVKDHAALYARKLEIIERNLYGVDKDPFAVNIAMLRLWLSLVVDDERDPLHDPTADVSLPNLKFKICIGDSLTAPAPDLSGLSLQRDHYIADAEKLAALYDQYFLLAHDKQGRSKTELEMQIAAVQKDIADLFGTQAPEDAADWRVCFAEVFAPKSPFRTMDGRFGFANEVTAQQTFVEEDSDESGSGFDIIVANPPYGVIVSGMYKNLVSQNDSYTSFIGLAHKLTKSEGISIFINPTSWETGEQFLKFRKWLFGNNRVISVVNLPYDVFDAPYVDTCILIFQKSASNTSSAPSIQIATLPKRGEGGLENINAHLNALDLSAVLNDSKLRLVLSAEAAGLLGRLIKHPPLSILACLKRGIEAYQYQILEQSLDASWSPYFDGTVKRYTVEPSLVSLYVKPKKIDVAWHEGPRLVVRRLVSRANRLMAARMTTQYVVKKDLYVLKTNEGVADTVLTYLLGLLNSSLWSYLYLTRSASATKDDFRQVTLEGLRGLPLPPETTDHSAVVQLVNEIEDSILRGAEWHELDQQLDKVVFDLYGVTEPEREQIAIFLAQKA